MQFNHIKSTDQAIYECLQRQAALDHSTLKMIASENFASEAVLEATGSFLCNKYAEGYPGSRYYEGNEVYDEIERLAVSRLCALFGAEHANVQPYSGSPANQAVYRAVLRPGDKVMGMPVPEGGHLTHGWKVNFSGSDYQQVPYGVSPLSGRIDYDELRRIAQRERPRLIWIGCTAYTRQFDYKVVADIAREVEAYVAADIAHISGLILGGVHANPVSYCDIVTSTSHKTLRGPRGGFILCKRSDPYQAKYYSHTKFDLAKRIDRAVFPALQGGPHMNAIAALAVALHEASRPEFRDYAAAVVANARALAEELMLVGYAVVSGGTDNHQVILDFSKERFTGKEVAKALAQAGIICNFNMVPGDARKPTETSGVRLGTAALTTQHCTTEDMRRIARWIAEVCRRLRTTSGVEDIRAEVGQFAAALHIPATMDA